MVFAETGGACHELESQADLCAASRSRRPVIGLSGFMSFLLCGKAVLPVERQNRFFCGPVSERVGMLHTINKEGVLTLAVSSPAYSQSYTISTLDCGGPPVNIPGTAASLGPNVLKLLRSIARATFFSWIKAPSSDWPPQPAS